MSGARYTAEQITDAYRRTLDWRDPTARLVLADLADACGVSRTSQVPGDPYESAFNEGRRAIFLYVAGRIGLPLIPET